jgi:hypothetical protein
MGSDHYFRMGSTHAICQDYALSGVSVRGATYALLSDGCSGTPVAGDPGSPHTDYGARFLVRAAQRHLRDLSNGLFPADVIITEADAMARQVDLRRTALDATLLGVVTTDSGYAHTYHTGDGVIACKRRNGKIEYTSRQFGNGAPYYLSYLLDRDREHSLLYPDPCTHSPEEVEAGGTVEETHGWFDPETKTWGRVTQKLSLVRRSQTLEANAEQVDRGIVSAENVEVVLIMSDGASSFQLKNGTPVPLEDVLDQLFAIKGYGGEFLTRRCNAFLQRFCVERGWQHSDDFAVAGIYLGATP